MTEIRIADHTLGPGQPCYVIAEAGVNHDGDRESARLLVRAAKDAGADAVKFQLFQASEIASAKAAKAGYQVANTGPHESQRDMLRALELADEAFSDLAAEAERCGIDFLCTAYSERGIEVLERIPVAAFKLASAQIVELPLLAHVAAKGRPMIVSTGMATFEEVEEALETIEAAGAPPVILLQCTTDYPTALGEANVFSMTTLAERFERLVGYSDHTLGDIASSTAVARGAVVIEKHLTLDRSLPGPDHSASLEPDEFKRFVRRIRDTETALGSSHKQPSQRERSNAFDMRRSLFAAEDIPEGTVIEPRHVALKRPASGLHPRELYRIVGTRAKVDIPGDTPIRDEDLVA